MRGRASLFAVLAVAVLGLAASALASGLTIPSMGPETKVRRPAFHGFYDGHKDTFLNTDVSDKAQAKAFHINFAPTLRSVPERATPELYFFQGRAAPGQLPVFASEPGESNYSPLWHEVVVTWKAGVTPSLLKSDTAVEAKIRQGQLIERHTKIVLNCPIIKVGR